jgi:hypothetical protein
MNGWLTPVFPCGNNITRNRALKARVSYLIGVAGRFK